jgi:hypothetical protein
VNQFVATCASDSSPQELRLARSYLRAKYNVTTPPSSRAAVYSSNIHTPLILAATTTSGVQSRVGCRTRAKCIVDPYALEYMGVHYPIMSPAWNSEAPAGGPISIPYHHDNFECFDESVAMMYHMRADKVVNAAYWKQVRRTARSGLLAMRVCSNCAWDDPRVDFTIPNRCDCLVVICI